MMMIVVVVDVVVVTTTAIIIIIIIIIIITMTMLMSSACWVNHINCRLISYRRQAGRSYGIHGYRRELLRHRRRVVFLFRSGSVIVYTAYARYDPYNFNRFNYKLHSLSNVNMVCECS
jgi:hypothetical protein